MDPGGVDLGVDSEWILGLTLEWTLKWTLEWSLKWKMLVFHWFYNDFRDSRLDLGGV